MAEGSSPTKLAHLPALDGLRGLAVIGVLCFHGGFHTFQGGFLGVSTFFTLSGFLITSLLLREHATTGTISLRAFWGRRFRRLMPAALATLLLVCLYGLWFASPEQLATLRGDIFAALAYVANWRFVFENKRYADLFAAPSPVQHFWSLAIEEQFYVIYPLLVYVVLRVGGRRALTATLGVLAAISVTLSFALASNPDRVYYGTDTRAFELIAGALFALWWSSASSRTPQRLPRVSREFIGVAGLVASLAAWVLVAQTSTRLAHGGFAAQAVATVAVLVAITSNGWLTDALSWRPLRAVGLVSYGLYVYHWPVFLVLNQARFNNDINQVVLFAIRLAVTVVLTLASYWLLEQPIRHRRVLSASTVRVLAPLAVLAVVFSAIGVTWDPPASTVAYANADPTDFAPRVVTQATLAPADTSPTASTTIVASSPLAKTVMFVGDSGMADLQAALGPAYGAAGVGRVIYGADPGFGLARPVFDWRVEWRKLIDANRPDIVVVMLGGWDLDYLKKNGAAAYSAVVQDAVSVFTAQGAHVLWLAMLPGGATPDRRVDPIYEAVAASHPGVVEYFDPEAVLRTGDGPNGPVYERVLASAATKLLLRKPDAWHLCPAGAERLATEVLHHTATLGWSAVPVGGWQTGAWRNDGAFNDPVGGCDPKSVGADQ